MAIKKAKNRRVRKKKSRKIGESYLKKNEKLKGEGVLKRKTKGIIASKAQ
ncbi:hypothetical protein HX004_02235 [Myroides sp. 1354]|nr:MULTISPECIES: hypothetical protein [unclassified Myroides]MDM1043341.1 hypothetical protein [Myroides sp. R163-1]MDM1054606.1 hypothetical protein [Myroides sp. 1354]MDM1067903.1 hypothetical protein [Myroides sp. 1372]